MVEKTKDASRIGILVGTLGASRYGTIINQIRDTVKAAGKKVYIFLLGKPNVPKLANFPEIDVFVLVACPENSLLDSKDFLQPIITPFELDVALNGNREWNGDFHANFKVVCSLFDTDLFYDNDIFRYFPVVSTVETTRPLNAL
jgi:diphthamide biosynthesis protein 2